MHGARGLLFARGGPAVAGWMTGVCLPQACAQADMAHRRGYPFDMPYPAANRRCAFPGEDSLCVACGLLPARAQAACALACARPHVAALDRPACFLARCRMMFPPFHGGDGWGASEEELAHYGMGIGPHAGAMCNGRPAQAIDIDFGGMKGRRVHLNAGKQPQVKRELVIFPRRKAGQDKRQADNEAPVKLTPEILDKISDIPLVAAAKKLGISKTALKNACRHLVSPPARHPCGLLARARRARTRPPLPERLTRREESGPQAVAFQAKT